MPKTKNQAKNKSRFEIRGGILNEYEFEQNEEAMAEEERSRFEQLEAAREPREAEEGGAAAAISPQEREAARIREVIETAHEKAQRNMEKRRRESVGGAQSSSRKGASKSAAKRDTARKSSGGAAKKGAKKSVPSGSSRGSARGGSTRKGAAKKGSAKKGSAKRATRSGARRRG